MLLSLAATDVSPGDDAMVLRLGEYLGRRFELAYANVDLERFSAGFGNGAV